MHLVHLVGHSMGAVVALHCAIKMPEKIANLSLYEPVLMNLSHFCDHVARETPRALKVYSTMCSAMLDHNNDCAAEVFVDYWSGDGTWKKTPELHKQHILNRLQKVPRDFELLAVYEAPPESYRQLAFPILLLSGQRSEPLPLKIVDALQSYFDNADVHQIADANHMAPATHPHLTTPIILDFLHRTHTQNQAA